MLKIVNETGQVLELGAGQSISYEKNNPLFNDSDAFFQDISYQVTAPMSENNKLFFGFSNLIEAGNDVYVLPAKFYADEILMAAGNVRCAIRPDGFEVNLEPNYAAINSLVNNIRLTEIRTEDADFVTGATTAGIEALMLDTCQNPDKYPYIYFPVYNLSLDDPDPGDSYQFVNYFSSSLQKCIASYLPGTDVSHWAQSPFWKLSYIFKQVANYLGFEATGDFFSDPESKNICIYSRRAEYGGDIFPSMTYMPNMLISDFLKFCRNRLHLSIDPDLVSGTITFTSFKNMVDSTEVTDITPYVNYTVEQEIPDKQDCTVTLKTDEQDLALQVVEGDNSSYPPLFKLVVGEGTNTIELDCSTTRMMDNSLPGSPGAKYPRVHQTLINGKNIPGIPDDIQFTDPNDYTTLNNWPLRLLRYLGYQELADGSFYPNTESMELNDDDLLYYRFLNDSKRLIIYCSFPPTVLASLKITRKITFKTKGYNYTTAIMEKIDYDAGLDTELIQAKIYARTLTISDATQAGITSLSFVDDPDGYQYYDSVKAYFDPALHGFKQLNIDIVPTSGTSTWFIRPITIPTNPKGAGGVAEPIILNIAGGGVASDTYELRISQGQPKYALHWGSRVYFSQRDGYSYITLTLMGAGSYRDRTRDIYTIFF